VELLAIQEVLGRSENFVQRWSNVYRDRGTDAILAAARGGRKTKLAATDHERPRVRLEGGLTEKNQVCTFRENNVDPIIACEFGIKLWLSSAYRVLHRRIIVI
jgi:transposase